jgi:hypothetical protein
MEKNYPWFNGTEMLPICGGFLFWNTLMACMMIMVVFVPISNGFCTAG